MNSYIFWLTFSYIYHFFSRTMATSLGYVLMNWTSTFSKRNKRKKNNIKNNVPPITTKETIGCQTFHVDEGKFLVKMINFRSDFLVHDENHQLPFHDSNSDFESNEFKMAIIIMKRFWNSIYVNCLCMNLIIPYLVTIALPFLREKGNPSFYLWIDLNILIGNMTTLAYCQIYDGIFFFFSFWKNALT